MIRSWFSSVDDPRFDTIAAAYRSCGLWSTVYSKVRMALCPLLDIEAALPAGGTFVDVGCGAGLLLQWLALGREDGGRCLIGMEIDPRRVKLGQKVCRNLAISKLVDLRVEAFGSGDGERDLAAVVFVDVLHHMDYSLQKKMLVHAFKSLKDGGRVVVKDVGTAPAVKYLYNYLFDAMTSVTKITRGKVGYYRSQSGWMSLLSECGFRPGIIEVRHVDFAPHILLAGEKEGTRVSG
jgi:cyclopropane fatty-acyl-phospholipid synthase-like methyltransferase